MKREKASTKLKQMVNVTMTPDRWAWQGHSRKEALQEMRRQIQQMREEIKRAKRVPNPR
jgi:hypothetical protein